MASFVYASYTKDTDKGSGDAVDWLNDTIKVLLCTSSYTPSQTGHHYKSSVTNEVTGTGYTAGGATLAGKTITVSGANGQYDANDVTWSASTITARYAVVYKDTGTAGTSPLVALIDFGSDKGTVGVDFVLQWAATGVYYLAA